VEMLFQCKDEERNRVLEVVKLDDSEFESIVWRAEHSRVEFVPSDGTFLLWEASGKLTVRALGVLAGKTLNGREIELFRRAGVLGTPEKRGKRSIFPLSWKNIGV